MQNNLKNKDGTSMLEIIVALALFSTVMTISLLTFQGVITGQRSTLYAQNVQESMRFAFEIISKEVRFAKKRDDGDCITTDNASPNRNNKVYDTNTAGTELRFVNSSGICTTYDVNSDRFRITRGGEQFFFTPDEILVGEFHVSVNDDGVNDSPLTQSSATITVNGSMGFGASSTIESFQIQTTISSRNYQ